MKLVPKVEWGKRGATEEEKMDRMQAKRTMGLGAGGSLLQSFKALRPARSGAGVTRPFFEDKIDEW